MSHYITTDGFFHVTNEHSCTVGVGHDLVGYYHGHTEFVGNFLQVAEKLG
jgi:hypothetical protein